MVMNWTFTDVTDPKQAKCMVEVSNGALSCSLERQATQSNVTVVLERSALDELLLGEKTLKEVMDEVG